MCFTSIFLCLLLNSSFPFLRPLVRNIEVYTRQFRKQGILFSNPLKGITPDFERMYYNSEMRKSAEMSTPGPLSAAVSAGEKCGAGVQMIRLKAEVD